MYTTTGMRFLTESHLELWRKAVFLFREQKNRSGPFAKCGYTQYLIEFQTKSNEIDIVAWNPSDSKSSDPYYALELTTNPNSDKHDQLNAYSKLQPIVFYNIGIQSESSPIPVLVTSSFKTDHDEYCQLELKQTLIAHNLNCLKNPELEKELSKQIDLDHIPQTSFTILPESKDVELRQGIIDSLMTVFTPKYESFTAKMITEMALDYISDNIDLKKKKILINRVNSILYILSQNQLAEYVTFQNGVYIPTEKGRKMIANPNSRSAFLSRLRDWANGSNTTLDRWIDESN